MTKPKVVPIHTAENLGKAYIDPETTQIIIDQIADLKRKLALAEEQLRIMSQENAD